MNVPKLRFSEFEGEWDKAPLNRYARMQGGYAFKSEDFSSTGIPVVRISNISATSGVVNLTQAVKHPKISRDESFRIGLGDILIALSGATTGKACIYNLEDLAYLNQRVGLLKKASEKLHYDYLVTLVFSELFSQQLMATLVAGAQPNVSPKDIEKFEFGFPSLPEQKKIAAFLGVVDAKIAALRARRDGLERYKRGLMQALFSQTLRFTKPDGTPFPEWEEKRLGEVATRSTSKNTKLEHMRVLTNSAVQGVVDQGAYFDKDIANAENLAGYYVLKKGDFVYNPRISSSAPVGPIKRNDLGDGVMSPLYTVFRFKQKGTTFYNVYFATTFWHKYMKSVANYGARHDRMAITASDLMNMPLPHPHPDEQQKIADALSAMDDKVAVVTKQVTQMEAFKKGLLQQMFV